MRISLHAFSTALVLVAALMVLVETLYFASLKPGYKHGRNTISELGETGAPNAREVAFGFFLPVGLLVWLALWLVRPGAPDRYASFALAALSCLGTGYALSAFFPCDAGGPLLGTWRTLIHNFLGFIDYTGTGIGFLLFSRSLGNQKASTRAAAFWAAGVLEILTVPLLFMFSLESSLHIRGAVQRVAEVIQFSGVFFVCHLLSGKMTNNKTRSRPPVAPVAS